MSRLRQAAGQCRTFLFDDITMFVRMTVAAHSEERRAKAIDVLLAGVICPVERNSVDSGQI
jgi:hypothetical protein